LCILTSWPFHHFRVVRTNNVVKYGLIVMTRGLAW
jgi:hypothetical protein